MDTNLSTKVFKNLHKIKYFPNKCVVRPFNEGNVSATFQTVIYQIVIYLIYCNKAQCPRTDLNKRSLPRPKTTTV